MGKRDARILELVTAEGKIEVARLATELGVSSVTMRKDLDALQAQGLVLREHGYAILKNPADVGGRLAYHWEQKRAIARRAAGLVDDGATIMIESGSCCALLAAELAETKAGVTLVTNSAFIASYVRDAKIDVVLLGGSYQKDSQVMVGPLVRTCAEEFYVDTLFVGTDGWIDGVGFTNADQMRADAVRSMAQVAGRVVVLTESEKFGHHSAVPLRLAGKPVTLVTDEGLEETQRASLERAGIHVLLAEDD